MLDSKEQECMNELKKLIQESPEQRINKLFDKDEYLIQFIRGRKYDVKYAFETIKYDSEFRHKIFRKENENLRPSLLGHVFDRKVFGILKNRDDEGRVIIFFRHNNLKNITAWDIKLLIFLLVREVGCLIDAQLNGVSIIIDYEGYPAELIQQTNLLEIKQIINGITSVSRSGYEDLLKKFSPDILPDWLGGRLKDEEAVDYEFIQRIKDKEEIYANYNVIY